MTFLMLNTDQGGQRKENGLKLPLRPFVSLRH